MANGAAIALRLVPEIASSAAVLNQPVNEIDVQLGEAVAAGAWVISAAADGYRQTGVLAQASKDASADRIAAVAMLALAYAGGDEIH